MIADVSSEIVEAIETWFAFRSVTVDLQRVHGSGVGGYRLLLGVGCLLRARRRGLRVGGRLLRLLQLRVLVGQVGLQAVDLALHFLAQRLDLFLNGWALGLGGLSGRMFLGGRRCIACSGVRAD